MALSYTVEQIVHLCFPNSSILGNGKIIIEGVLDLKSATKGHLSFFANERYLSDMKASKAGAIIVPKIMEMSLRSNNNQAYIFHENPTSAFQQVLTLFQGQKTPSYTGFSGIHPTAIIHQTAIIGTEVSIGPYAVIDENVVIGDKTQILPHSYIGKGTKLGKECIVHAHSVIREECLLQDRVIIQPGAVIGSCGFGYTTDAKGTHTKLHHWGNVVVENDVEIGANSTIDRGRFQATRIGCGTKIDNLVQIAHNVLIGQGCFIVSQVGIAGSSVIGNHVVLAGKVGVAGHLEITDMAVVAAYSAVTKSIKEPGKYSGIPAQKAEKYNKNAVYLRKIETLFDRVAILEKLVLSSS